MVAQVAQRDALVSLVNSQAGELEALRGRVGALRRKDVSVYGA